VNKEAEEWNCSTPLLSNGKWSPNRLRFNAFCNDLSSVCISDRVKIKGSYEI
jgi:hypothetical protein